MTATETHTTEPGPAFRAVERVGNKVPRAFWIFWYLLIATGIVSAILAATHTTVTTPGTDKTVAVNNILSIAGLQHLLSTFVANFIGFPPLGVVLTVLLGVGVAERTGFLKAAVVAFLAHVPAKLVPFAVMFVAGQGHVMGDASVIVLPPLAALVSRAAGRHPLAGLLGSFGGTMTGYASGVLIGALDANLSTLTASAVPHGINANMSVLMNYWFQAASGLVIPIATTFVLVRWLEPSLPKFDPDAAGDAAELSAGLLQRERKALTAALVALAVVLAVILAAWLVPGGPLQGKNGDLIVSPFFTGIVPILALAFFVVGAVYGVVVGTVTRPEDLVTMMADALRSMATYILIAVSAGQFLAMFGWSNVGTWISLHAVNSLRSMHIGGFGVIVITIVFCALLALLITSGSSLWAVLSPILVPIYTRLGLEPAVAQATYRVGDCLSHGISPVNPYVYVLHEQAKRWDPRFTLGMIFSRMMLFVLPVAVIWTATLAIFYFARIPTGPGTSIFLGG